MASHSTDRPSLETLIEDLDLGLEVLHPGGLEITRELAQLCRIGRGARVLDVASGTGAAAEFLAETLGCSVVGVDASDSMLERASKRLRGLSLAVEFRKGDVHNLPFEAGTFDAVICECTLCLFRKQQALREMIRVAKPGGCVGMHDLSWKEGAPGRLKQRLKEIEHEEPETLDGWKRLFEQAGLAEVRAFDRSQLIPAWIKAERKKLGLRGHYKAGRAAIQRWGLGGLLTILQVERLFASPHVGYAIVVGVKP